jgi:hypothetical protein
MEAFAVAMSGGGFSRACHLEIELGRNTNLTDGNLPLQLA